MWRNRWQLVSAERSIPSIFHARIEQNVVYQYV
ncbi:DNA ligase [Vibrio alginolyticus 12G01]|nr:DNA ligase [Vibrio alginolyticus 12G01]